jgi:hypothetical protein
MTYLENDYITYLSPPTINQSSLISHPFANLSNPSREYKNLTNHHVVYCPIGLGLFRPSNSTSTPFNNLLRMS